MTTLTVGVENLFIPDHVEGSDEYYSYFIRRTEQPDRTKGIFKGEIWANVGDHADEKIPVAITFAFPKQVATISITSRMTGERRGKQNYTSKHLKYDITEIIHNLIAGIKEKIPEIMSAYYSQMPRNSV